MANWVHSIIRNLCVIESGVTAFAVTAGATGMEPFSGALLPAVLAAASGGYLWATRARQAPQLPPADPYGPPYTAALATAGPDTCVVCGCDGLLALDSEDDFFERGEDARRVVPYGESRAHWDCSVIVSYVKPVPTISVAGYQMGLTDDERARARKMRASVAGKCWRCNLLPGPLGNVGSLHMRHMTRQVWCPLCDAQHERDQGRVSLVEYNDFFAEHYQHERR